MESESSAEMSINPTSLVCLLTIVKGTLCNFLPLEVVYSKQRRSHDFAQSWELLSLPLQPVGNMTGLRQKSYSWRTSNVLKGTFYAKFTFTWFEHKCVLSECAHNHPIMMEIYPVVVVVFLFFCFFLNPHNL